jgi:hypothetical protein
MTAEIQNAENIGDDVESLEWLGKVLDLHPSEVVLPERYQLRSRTSEAETVRDLMIETLLKVRNKNRRLVILRPNRAQKEYSRSCTRRNIVLKARQLGITTYVAARFFIQTITQPGTVSLQVAHDQESAEDIFRIVHRFWENLPREMQGGALCTSRANVRQIAFPMLDSEYRVGTAADEDAGRGTTVHNLHCSEVARWPGDPQETLTSLRATVPPGDGNIVLESTPNGAGGIFYEEWQQADETAYTRHFFPWWYDNAYRVKADAAAFARLTDEESELVCRAGLNTEQIGWRRAMGSQLRGMMAQEYAEDPISCFRASGECVFDLDAIEHAAEGASEPVESHDNQRLTVWFPPQADKEYIVGVDPAGGLSEGDFSCAEVVERTTGLQCAELHGHFPPRELATQLVELAKRYGQALLAVERNNHGHGVLAHLHNLGYANVYRERKQEGWLTSAVTRPAMIENLAGMVVTEPGLFQSARLLNEFRTFVRQADGSSCALSGSHDDCVMAMAIALAARQAVAGKNFATPTGGIG